MTKSILTVSAWKLFFAFFGGLIAAMVIAFVTARYFDWDLDYGPYPTLQFGLMSVIWWTYPYLVGRALSHRSVTGFGVVSHGRILVIFLVALACNLFSAKYTGAVVWPVALLSTLVNFYCLVEIFSYPARLLKSRELGRSAPFLEYWSEMIQFMLWPVCVWWLQPTLTYIVIEEEVLKKKG